jgi:hypothetical protein
MLPLIFFLLSIIVAGIFWPQLPAEMAYHFQADSPDKMMSSGAFIAWMLIPHVFFLLVAIALVRVVMLGARYAPAGETPFQILLPLMGNMIALPQIVLFFIMVQVILYNAYQFKFIPLWLTSLIILVLGAIFLVIVFIRLVRRYRRNKSQAGRTD